MAAHLLKALDLYTLPLRGTQLVEASAGTGKTWTIAGLYVRLLLETEATLDRLLVVTFTKAATAELRERLRARLSEVEQALQAGHSEDVFCQWALEKFTGEARTAALKKITQSLRIFDEAAIYTIHGFCQRVLDEVQLPALLNEPDIVPDERDWLPGLSQEAWIRHCRHPLLADVLAVNDLRPETIQADVSLLLQKPYLQINRSQPGIDIEQLAWRREALHQHWQKAKTDIAADLVEADGLSQAGGKEGYKDTAQLLMHLARWLEGGLLHADLYKLTPEKFEKSKSRKKNGKKPRHGFWQELADWFRAAEGVMLSFRLQLLDDVQQAMRAHKRECGLISYQDLLAYLAEAVTDPRLAAAIRSRYGAALIDEFQDTDPLQFRVFSTLFADAGMPLYLVGDPKQAIYSFRGADIFTYLRARQAAEGRYTLLTNRRSTPALVQAVNGIFSRHSNPFLFSDLGFPQVGAVADKPTLTPLQAPFQCYLLPAEQNKNGDRYLSKAVATELSVNSCVAEIARLLRAAETERTQLHGRDLQPGDIAVLVPTHQHGRAVVQALNRAAIPSVMRSQDSVFASQEAVHMQSLLQAVAEPGREGRVKAAFLTPLLGGTVEALYAAQESDAQWSALIARLLAARERWQRQGFMPMWEGLLREFSVYERMLADTGGERSLTNLRHLATLMQHQADADPVAERQLAWFGEQVREAAANEDTQLRLESDAARVQVLTIHVSKGLEYPVVFCPFLWEGGLKRNSDALRSDYRAGDAAVLDLGTDNFAHACKRMHSERLAERLRVLYVALTRAQYRCYGVWGWVKDSETAAFSWLLLGGNTEGDPDAEVIKRDLGACVHADYRQALDALSADLPQAFSWCLLDEVPAPSAPSSPATQADAPRLPDFSRSLQRRWRVSSFTGLSAAAHGADHSPLQESPDHDGTVSPAMTASAEERSVPQGIHAFPRGAAAGVFWHALLEEAVGEPDFDSEPRIADLLQTHALAADWQPLVQSALQSVLSTVLDGEGATLASLQAARVEMEFIYPVRGLEPGDFLALPDLPPLYREALTALDFPSLSGFLKGFIDLIYRHDGRYYVLDYKTNWLGPDESFYSEAAMQTAMAASHYYLQYWLYVLALHRHLQAVMPDYDYERDMGGVRYFFLRGFAAASHGVYCARPSKALIDALDALMRGVES